MSKTFVDANQRVLEALRAAGARRLTDEELVEASGLHPLTAPARRSELTKAGLVVSSGTTRPTTSGKLAIVWALASVANEATSHLVLMHAVGHAITTRGGTRLQICRSCGVSLPPEFAEGAVVYERAGAFAAARPVGIAFHPCRRARRTAES